jgi:hypothetical protein
MKALLEEAPTSRLFQQIALTTGWTSNAAMYRAQQL